MIGTNTGASKVGKPNPFRMEEFVGGAAKVAVKKKASKDATEMTDFASLEVVKGNFGSFLASPKGPEGAERYTVSVKKEITGNPARTPIAYLAVDTGKDTEKKYLCNLFKQVSQKGDVYLKGTNQDTGEVYLLFADRRGDGSKSGAAGNAAQ